MARFSEALAADREELFRRMVFNCCISNTDDHERNHGFVAADMPGRYRLSPAYDMVPRKHATQRREHALVIGADGYIATRRNLLSECTTFGLQRIQAQAMVDDIEERVQAGWKRALLEEGLSEAQAQDWATCFRPLPDAL
jgi:serine/threonine-protein kinase HipA